MVFAQTVFFDFQSPLSTTQGVLVLCQPFVELCRGKIPIVCASISLNNILGKVKEKAVLTWLPLHDQQPLLPPKAL